MSITLDALTVLDDTEIQKEKAKKQREKVADLIPVADKIKEAATRVVFTLDAKGANGELERLRQAARFQGFSLRILSRTPDKDDASKMVVTVKAGALIEREKGTKDSTDDAPAVTTATIPAPVKAEVPKTETPKAEPAKPSAKPSK